MTGPVPFAPQLTTRAVTAATTVAPNEFVAADATTAAFTITGPAAGTSRRWGVKKTDTSSNAVTISYVNAAGTVTTIGLLVGEDAKTFEAIGSGYIASGTDRSRATDDLRYQTALSGDGKIGRANRYRAEPSIYNLKPGKLLRSRAQLATVMNDATVLSNEFRILDTGDSMTAAYPVGMQRGRSVALRKLFAARGYPIADTGYITGWGNPSTDSRWSFPSGWGAPAGNTANYILGATTNQALLTTDINCTYVDVAVLDDSPTQAYHLFVDGTDLGAVTLGNTAAANVFRRSALSGTATHTIGITPSTSSGLNLVGVRAHANNGGVSVTNAGIGGAQTGQWTDTTSYKSPSNLMKSLVNPHLVTIMLGYNDISSGKSASQFTTDLVTTANLYTANSDVILIVEPAPATSNVSAANWLAYQQACYDAADILDVPLIDISARWGTNTAANGFGLKQSDGIHSTAPGYADIAAATLAAITG